MCIELKDLVGIHTLTGVEMGTTSVYRYGSSQDVGCIKFTLDEKTYCAVEDPDDGYRSYLGALLVSDDICKIRLPNITVLCKMREDSLYEKNDVLVFIDVNNGKEILAVGTANIEDYYPYCVIEYTPENMSCNEGVETK